MSYYVYILKSGFNNRYYIGSCSDVEKRLQRHNAGATPSTKPYRPWEVVYFEIFESKTEALMRENYIKRMKSRTFIESLITSIRANFQVLVQASVWTLLPSNCIIWYFRFKKPDGIEMLYF